MPCPAAREGAALASPHFTEDTLPGGTVTLLQPRHGARATTDSLLLAAVLPIGFDGHAVDFGAGTGAVAFRLAARCPCATVTGVEQDGATVAAARDALALPQNAAFAARVSLLEGDVTACQGRDGQLGRLERPVQAVLFNPPFGVEGQGRRSPHRARDAARSMPAGALRAWFAAAADLVASGGVVAAILPPARLRCALGAAGLGNAEVTGVHPRPGAPARRLIVTQRKGRRGDLVMRAPLILADADGRTPAPITALMENRTSLHDALSAGTPAARVP